MLLFFFYKGFKCVCGALELQVVVSCQIRILENELGSSVREECVFSC